ncbi:hypothetical protein RJ639_044851 [Escallonia herrerae]|uniref:General transcription and DNA repair factor IIH subunit TFB4 n=1 Tax=Escallonia herrerae TaxID=1293975 RepID=A0AA88W9F9_9ASTE|nr:hypothetical protein RJ639_044851 [Escallonia herrerae]
MTAEILLAKIVFRNWVSSPPEVNMSPVSSKLYADDVSLLMVLLDTNPFFWSTMNTSLSFSKFLSHVLSFLNSILLLNQLNQVAVIATGFNSCNYIYDSSYGSSNQRPESLLQRLEEFVVKDEELSTEDPVDRIRPSLLSGSLSMALCFVMGNSLTKLITNGGRYCVCMDPLTGLDSMLSVSFLAVTTISAPEGFTQRYVAIMNAIFSAQRSMRNLPKGGETSAGGGVLKKWKAVKQIIEKFTKSKIAISSTDFEVPIDSCLIGAQHSAFLQQVAYNLYWDLYIPAAKASYITGGVYLKPQLPDGLFQYLSTVFATDMQSRSFLQLPKPVGVDFRASYVLLF